MIEYRMIIIKVDRNNPDQEIERHSTIDTTDGLSLVQIAEELLYGNNINDYFKFVTPAPEPIDDNNLEKVLAVLYQQKGANFFYCFMRHDNNNYKCPIVNKIVFRL